MRSLSATASEILPGRLWVRARTNKLSVQNKQQLRDELKITDVVCVCLITDEEWRTRVGVDYWHFPWSDSKRAVPANLEATTQFVTERIELLGKRVLIYCDSGRNRSALLATNVVHRITGMSGKESVAFMRAGRPMALRNPLFIKYLEAL